MDILYLTDSVLQTCRNPKWPGCGPDSAPAQAYPRVIAAALPALIKAVSEDPEGAKKADKVRCTPPENTVPWRQARHGVIVIACMLAVVPGAFGLYTELHALPSTFPYGVCRSLSADRLAGSSTWSAQ